MKARRAPPAVQLDLSGDPTPIRWVREPGTARWVCHRCGVVSKHEGDERPRRRCGRCLALDRKRRAELAATASPPPPPPAPTSSPTLFTRNGQRIEICDRCGAEVFPAWTDDERATRTLVDAVSLPLALIAAPSRPILLRHSGRWHPQHTPAEEIARQRMPIRVELDEADVARFAAEHAHRFEAGIEREETPRWYVDHVCPRPGGVHRAG